MGSAKQVDLRKVRDELGVGIFCVPDAGGGDEELINQIFDQVGAVIGPRLKLSRTEVDLLLADAKRDAFLAFAEYDSGELVHRDDVIDEIDTALAKFAPKKKKPAAPKKKRRAKP